MCPAVRIHPSEFIGTQLPTAAAQFPLTVRREITIGQVNPRASAQALRNTGYSSQPPYYGMRPLWGRQLDAVMTQSTYCPGSISCACKLGLEGIVSKRLGSTYRSGRSRHWIKS